MIFLVAFLGSLFAILAALLIVYTYVTLRIIPSFARWFKGEGAEAMQAFGRVGEITEHAMKQQAAAPMQLVIPRPMSALATSLRADQVTTIMKVLDSEQQLMFAESMTMASKPVPPPPQAVVEFWCTAHGRCDGCPQIRDQFEAIAREQGDTMTPWEVEELENLRIAFPHGADDLSMQLIERRRLQERSIAQSVRQ